MGRAKWMPGGGVSAASPAAKARGPKLHAAPGHYTTDPPGKMDTLFNSGMTARRVTNYFLIPFGI